MDLKKCVIKGNHESEFYCKKNEVIDQKRCVLLGFKDSLPVLSNMSEDSRSSTDISPRKTLKVEVDSQTGEKYLNLNGRKLKMVTESELPLHLRQNVHMIKSHPGNGVLAKKPVKIKIIGSMSSIIRGSIKSITTPESQDVNKQVFKSNVNKPDSKADDSSYLKLSHKTVLIKGSKLKLPNAISNVHNVFAPCSTRVWEGKEVKQDNDKIKTTKCKTEVNKFKNSEMKTYQPPYNMKALDLTKLNEHTLFGNSEIVGIKSFVDKCVQTDDKSTVSAFVQTDKEESRNLDSDILRSPALDLNFDLLDYIGSATPMYMNTSDQMIPELPSKSVMSQQSNRVSMFFNDLRASLLPDDKGNMPIHVGVLTNNINLVKRHCSVLKALQKSVDLPNHGELTALQLAVITNTSPQIIETLLWNGASLDTTDAEGNNVVHLAVEFKRQEILQIILKVGIQRNFELDQFNAEGFTPLMICCCERFLNGAELLLHYGADVNVRDRKSGRTPLFHAAENSDLDMVNLLLNYNADTKIKNFFGTSPHDAMYEVEEISDDIKTTILRKASKRKANEEPKVPRIKKKDYSRKPLKTYARYKKIEDYEFPNKITTAAN